MELQYWSRLSFPSLSDVSRRLRPKLKQWTMRLSGSSVRPSRPLPDVPFYSNLAEPEMLLSHAHCKGQCVRVPIQPIFGGTEFLRSLGRRKQPIAIHTRLRLVAR